MFRNSSDALRGILMAMTAGELPIVEVTWQAGYTGGRDDEIPPELTLRQPNQGPVVLIWHDGLERLAAALHTQLPRRMRAATIVRRGDTLRVTNAR